MKSGTIFFSLPNRGLNKDFIGLLFEPRFQDLNTEVGCFDMFVIKE